jgi:hypothetical protein
MPNAKLIPIDSIGTVVSPADFHAWIEHHHLSVRLLCKVRKKSGAQWTAAFVEGIGLAVASHQTHRVFVIDCQTLADLACEAGIEDRPGLIIVPKGLDGPAWGVMPPPPGSHS